MQATITVTADTLAGLEAAAEMAANLVRTAAQNEDGKAEGEGYDSDGNQGYTVAVTGALPYTHHADDEVTDPVGSVIDVDGERFVIGPDQGDLKGTASWGWDLSAYDYSLISTPAQQTAHDVQHTEADPADVDNCELCGGAASLSPETGRLVHGVNDGNQ